jgi:site-specific DNA-methyltransferase (adenine-specific)
MSEVIVHHGDSREVLKGIPDASVDSCVTDAPYALTEILKRFGSPTAAAVKPGKTGAYARASAGFMGQKWDTGEAAHDAGFWSEVLRALKPGGHLVAFSGTRTQHRQVCAIEDAGFEIRDTVLDLVAADTFAMRFLASLDEEQRRAFALALEESSLGGMLAWAFGSGFPKSHNQDGPWEGWGSALKPAFEPICVARKPMTATIAGNLAAHGVGALNINGCRVGTDDNLDGGAYAKAPTERGEMWGAAAGNRWRQGGAGEFVQPQGRWPANVIHDGSSEVVEAFPANAGAFAPVRGTEPSNAITDVYGARTRVAAQHHGDSGSAARFFYSAKADAEDRLGSKHPTVKPIDLMAWLCRLVTPPGGVILDPFAGTGTTGLAAMREGFDCILIEREAQYVADIHRRLAWARGEGRLTALEIARLDDPEVHAKAVGDDLPLFSSERGAA